MTRTVPVSTGTSGIGRATAQLLASRGWRVCIGDLTPPAVALASVSYDPRDVRFADQWRAALGGCCGDATCRDVFVNNASVVRYGRFEEITEADSAMIVDVSRRA